MKSFTQAALLSGLALSMFLPAANASFLAGTTLTLPGQNFILNPVSAPAGSLLASLAAPYSFSTTAGTTSGTLTSAVFRNPSGTLDFYYQVANSASSATAIARETDTSFTGFGTALGFVANGTTLPGGLFQAGVVPPIITGDRNAAGSVVGFSVNQQDTNKVQPGTASAVFVISTDATNYTAGNAAVIDGGTQTVAAFQPTSGVPEPVSMFLMGSGLLALAGVRRFKKSA